MEYQTNYLLLLGGCGNLGSAIVECFTKKNWKVLILDHKHNTKSLTEYTELITIDNKIYEDPRIIHEKINNYLKVNKITGFNAIINSAGGFEYTSIKDDSFLSKGLMLIEKNYMSSLLTAHLAVKHLLSNSVVIFTGSAKAFKETTSELLLYQTSKTATHSVAMTLKDSKELPNDTCIITILPDIFNTPENRKAMPLEDFSKWTSTSHTAELLLMWCNGINKPKSGSFALLKSKDEMVLPEFV